jgi:S1-C subfamily serine protease
MKENTTQATGAIDEILGAVVSITAHIPEDAMSADLLGTERSGHGVFIREDGLIVTVGYIVLDAETIWVGTDENTLVPAYLIANDFDSGLALLKPSLPVDVHAVELGSAADLETGEPVFVVGSGGISDTIEARVVAKHEFAGRWEYLLEEAVYTAPVHPGWAGTAMLDGSGRLCGIGSLMLQDPGISTREAPVNLIIPIDTIAPVLNELCQYGRRRTPPRPWLGMLIHEDEEQLLVAGVYRGCPADSAGLRPGDIIVRVCGRPPFSLADFLRRVWARGPAGVSVPLTVLRDSELVEVTVETTERNAFMHKDTIN